MSKCLCDTGWERESPSCVRVEFLASQLHPRRDSHFQEYLGSITWPRRKKETQTRVRRGQWGSILEDSGKGQNLSKALKLFSQFCAGHCPG